MSRASSWRRGRTGADAKRSSGSRLEVRFERCRARLPPLGAPSMSVGHRRACASLVASFAAGAREAGARTDAALFHTGALIATFHCVAPRCGTFDDQRRIVAGDEGGRDTLI